MTREEAKKFYPILQAYAEGKAIESRIAPSAVKCKDTPNDWSEMAEIEHWNNVEYRVKSEPKYRPFKDTDECWQEMQKHKPLGWVRDEPMMCSVLNIGIDGIIIHNGVDNSWYDFKNAFNLTFADGTPFGIKVEE